jgi:hypothetical protein
MAAAKSLTPAEIQQVLDYIASSANAARNRCLFLMSVPLQKGHCPGSFVISTVPSESRIPRRIVFPFKSFLTNNYMFFPSSSVKYWESLNLDFNK